MVIVDLLTDDGTDQEIKALINRDEYVTFMCMQGVDVGDLIKPETSAQQTWWGWGCIWFKQTVEKAKGH